MTIKQLPAFHRHNRPGVGQGASETVEVPLPEGTRQPWLNTDFGNTITLLLALVSPPITDAECVARANLVREHLTEIAQRSGFSTNRAALAAFLPPSIAQSYREVLTGRFETAIRAAGLAEEGADDSRPFVHSGGPGNFRQPR